LLLSAAIIVLDQTTKLAVRSVFHTGDEQPITGFFSLTLAFNTGAAFSFMRDAGVWPRYLFSAVALAAAVLIIWLLRRGRRWHCAGPAPILGGWPGTDRADTSSTSQSFHWERWYYPAFNVADSAITVGAALLIFDSFRRRHDDRATAHE
jgi:signal peptidase II